MHFWHRSAFPPDAAGARLPKVTDNVTRQSPRSCASQTKSKGNPASDLAPRPRPPAWICGRQARTTLPMRWKTQLLCAWLYPHSPQVGSQ
jgi:hypothetical protein